jgi:hypothetical protein
MSKSEKARGRSRYKRCFERATDLFPILSIFPQASQMALLSTPLGEWAAIRAAHSPPLFVPGPGIGLQASSAANHAQGSTASPTMGNLGGMRRSTMCCQIFGVDGPTRLRPAKEADRHFDESLWAAHPCHCIARYTLDYHSITPHVPVKCLSIYPLRAISLRSGTARRFLTTGQSVDCEGLVVKSLHPAAGILRQKR